MLNIVVDGVSVSEFDPNHIPEQVYAILNNIRSVHTALVSGETDVDVSPETAAEIMKLNVDELNLSFFGTDDGKLVMSIK